jgi:hypothetical protein
MFELLNGSGFFGFDVSSVSDVADGVCAAA